jgi:Mg/Co/Ni transporter MgtE
MVDINNRKVIRVNDIQLLKTETDLMVANVDIGIRGLFRRLGWQGFVDSVVKLFAPESAYLKKEEFISWKDIQLLSINPVSKTIKLNVPQKEIMNIPVADLGDIMLEMDLPERIAFFKGLDMKLKTKIFDNMDPEEQIDIIRGLEKKEAAEIIGNMAPDNAVDLLEELQHDVTRDLLAIMETARARKLSTLLGYESDSAGGLMNTEYIALPETVNAHQALEYIKNKEYTPDFLYYVYVVDKNNRLLAATNLKRILAADPNENIMNIVTTKPVYARLHADAKKIAYLMDKYKAPAIAVVDEHKTMQGVITVDDVLEQLIPLAWRKRPRQKIKVEE